MWYIYSSTVLEDFPSICKHRYEMSLISFHCKSITENVSTKVITVGGNWNLLQMRCLWLNLCERHGNSCNIVHCHIKITSVEDVKVLVFKKFQKIRLKAILQENIVGQRVLLTKKMFGNLFLAIKCSEWLGTLSNDVTVSANRGRNVRHTYFFFILGSLEKWVKWVNFLKTYLHCTSSISGMDV